MKKLLIHATASLIALCSARAASFQEGFPGNAPDANFTLQTSPGFTYAVQPDPPTGVGQLWLYGQWGHSGQVSATTTFYAQGDFTTTVTAWSWAMTQGVYSGGCGNLGLLMSTSQGEASLYLQAAGDMGAAINFPSTASTTAWHGPIDYSGGSYDAYQLQISRSGDNLVLACYHEGRLYGQLTAADPAIASPAQFSLFLNYPAAAGDHTLSDNGWFENLAINADTLSTVPEPSVAALLAACTAYIFLRPSVAKLASGLRIRRRRSGP